MPTSDQYHDDLATPLQLRDQPPIEEGAAQPPLGLPRPPRQRPQRQPKAPPAPPSVQGTQDEELPGTRRQRLHRVAGHHVALLGDTPQIDVCVPDDDEIPIITYPTVREELLHEYPKDKLQATMR